METQTKGDLIRTILEDVEKDLEDEEVVHLILERKISLNLNTHKEDTFGQKAADKLAKFVGSWAFVILFCIILVLWMTANVLLVLKAFDPYPFILLNLVLSSVAAIQAPLIMMSQNRQEEKDRVRSENDYKVNLKTEIIIEDLHIKMDQLLENQRVIFELLEGKK